MRNTITRQRVAIACTCAVYNDGKLSTEIVFLPQSVNTEKAAENTIRKHNLVNGKLAAVVKFEKVSQLYGMDESKFLDLAKPIAERTKDTRDCITKTVSGLSGILVYLDKEYNVQYKPVMVKKGIDLDKQARQIAPQDCKGITIKDVKESEVLYALSEKEFFSNARPMRDYQHYITE